MFLTATLPTDLQILGSELHNNAFGGRAPPGPAGGAIAVLRPSSHYKREGRGRKGLGIGSEGVWRDGKGDGKDGSKSEGRLNLDICRGPPSYATDYCAALTLRLTSVSCGS